MRARIDIAVDREPKALVSTFVKPLDAALRQRGVGCVIRHADTDVLWLVVDLRLINIAAMDHVLEFLSNADAPVGSMVYRLNWLGHKRDMRVLGPPDAE